MLTAVFVLVVITMIVAHHFLIAERRERATEARSLTALGPLSALLPRFPDDVLFQPGFTWSRSNEKGGQVVGVHPLLLGLVGSPYELEVVAGFKVEKGSPLIRVNKGDRSLSLRSPISGRVMETRELTDRGDSEARKSDWDHWVCRVEPEDAEPRDSLWMSGDRALEWTQQMYADIRDHLMRGGVARGLGFALADGGELPLGVLGDLESWEWTAFQETFLDS
jgi:glycine cleavage system H lipoate-binding protein